MRIVLCYEIQPSHVRQIEQSFPGAEVVDAGQERIAQEILAADIFCGHAKVPVPWPEVVGQRRLQWIQSSAAGLDHCLVPTVIDSEIVVTGASGLFADQVAEHTLALLTGLTRKLPVFFRAAQQKQFVRRPTDDVHHKTVGIVGFGGNGQRIAEVLAPLKTRLLATDVFPDERPRPGYVESVWGADRLEDLLPPGRHPDSLRPTDRPDTRHDRSKGAGSHEARRLAGECRSRPRRDRSGPRRGTRIRPAGGRGLGRHRSGTAVAIQFHYGSIRM